MKKMILKKSATLMLALSCMLNTGVVFAEERISSGEIKGHFTAGNILDFVYVGEGVTDEDIASYKWERSTSETGTYATYSTDKSCITEMDNQKSKCTVYWYKVKGESKHDRI